MPTPEPTAVPPAGHFAYYPLSIAQVIRETAEACSLVFAIPPALQSVFGYQAGQYLTLRATVDGEVVERCYSLSSSPDTDDELKVTVKAVPGGRLSNWINDKLTAGAVVEVMPANGRFCLRDDEADLLLFAAGSGITPCISLIKTALATSARRVRLLYANRDRASVIFAGELAALQARYPQRFALVEHLDADSGLVTADQIRAVAAELPQADCYVCGPGPFMAIVESTLLAAGFDRHQVFVEYFQADTPAVESIVDAGGDETPETVTVIIGSQHIPLAYTPGETLLETARNAGLGLPYSCRIGACATCIAKVVEGKMQMMANHVLSDEEVAAGFVLVCQAIPLTRHVAIQYQ